MSRWKIRARILAFFVRLKVNKGQGRREIVPVIWEDNYISLLAWRKTRITASYRTSALGQRKTCRGSQRVECTLSGASRRCVPTGEDARRSSPVKQVVATCRRLTTDD